MPLAAYNPTWSTTLLSSLVFPTGNPAFATGKYSFVQSIVNGLVIGFTGSRVTTTDTGVFYASPGVGTGMGMTGFNIPAYSSTFNSLCLLKFQNFTLENSIIMNAIATTFTMALTQVNISTTHSTVTVGAGVVKLIPPDPITLSGILYSNAIPPINTNPIYSRWYDYSNIIASSIIAGCTTVVGSVIIAGVITIIGTPATGIGTGVMF